MRRLALAAVAILGIASAGCRSDEARPGEVRSGEARPASELGATPSAASAAPAAPTTPAPATATRATSTPGAKLAPSCSALPFAPDHVLEEASGAVVLASGDVAVIADSGHDGAYVILAPDGSLRAKGSAPLGEGASEDIEGLARRGNDHYGITSSGWIRRWQLKGSAFTLVDGPYPIDPTGNATCAKGTSWNCGPNYEGLCLRPTSLPGACDGFAVANADAKLVCLRFDKRGRLNVSDTHPLTIGFPGQLSGCTIGPDGSLWVVANRIGGNAIGLVEGWTDGGLPSLRLVHASVRGFYEAVAVGTGGELYVFSDEDPRRRNHRKFRCSR